MCGLVGVITKALNGLTHNQIDWFQDALIADAVRGVDGTGIFAVNPHKNFEIMKVASHPYHLLMNPEWGKTRTRALDAKILAGHNRKATTGDPKSLDCTHPFESKNGKIILMHNGFVENWKELGTNEPVDSMVACEVIANASTVEKAVSELRGAFALIWYNFEEHSINFLRNNQRPLYLAEDKSAIYWASEDTMLMWLAERNHLTPPEPKLLPEDSWLRYSVKSNRWTKSVQVQWGAFGKKILGGQSSVWSNNSVATGWEGQVTEELENDSPPWTEVEQATAQAMAAQQSTAKISPPLPLPSNISSLPMWERQIHAIDAMNSLSSKSHVFEATPLRIEDSDDKAKYKLWFVVHKPDIIKEHWMGLDGWTLRGYANFMTKVAANSWLKLPRFRIKPSGYTQCSHNDKMYIMEVHPEHIQEPMGSKIRLRSYNGVYFTPAEWQQFYSFHKRCTRCGVDYKVSNIQYVSIINLMDTNPVIVCPSCNQIEFRKLSDEIQHNMTVLNGVDLDKWHQDAT